MNNIIHDPHLFGNKKLIVIEFLYMLTNLAEKILYNVNIEIFYAQCYTLQKDRISDIGYNCMMKRVIMPLGSHVHITEVAPRDGFQILPGRQIPLEEKLQFIQSLIDAGCLEIEASSFVSPKWVPQLADSEEVCLHFSDITDTVMTYLVPNLKGAERAVKAGARQIFVTTSASNLHSRENLNQTIQEVLDGAALIAGLAREKGVVCTASVAAAFGYSRDPEGVSEERVCLMAKKLAAAGFTALTLCDTAGEGNPANVARICGQVIDCTGIPIGIHLHQAGGIEYANALAAFQAGIRVFESAAGGMGGCPYVPKAKGNIATETLVRMFHSMGIETGVDPELIQRCAVRAKEIQTIYGRPQSDVSRVISNEE